MPDAEIENLKKAVEDGKTALTNATTELESITAERDAALAEKTSLENTLATTATELETLRTEKDENDFQAFLNILPPGEKNGDEMVAGLREEWKKDQAGLKLRKADQLLNLAGPTSRTGTLHEPLPAAAQPRRKIGRCNVLTKKFED